MTRALTAIVLAGGSAHDPVALATEVSAKALAPLRGKPMAYYVLAALKKSPYIHAIIYVGAVTEDLEPLITARVPSGARLTDSLKAGLDAAMTYGKTRQLHILTADLPWLSTQALDSFIREAPDAALVYPIIAKAQTEAQFPGQRRTYAKVREGQFTGGNLILLKPELMPRLLEVVDRAYRARKNPLALGAILGFDVVFKLLLGRAKIGELEARVSKLLGAPVRAYHSEDASLGADVDKPEQLNSFLLP